MTVAPLVLILVLVVVLVRVRRARKARSAVASVASAVVVASALHSDDGPRSRGVSARFGGSRGAM